MGTTKVLLSSIEKKNKTKLNQFWQKPNLIGTKNVASNVGGAVVGGTKNAVNTTIETTGKVAHSAYDHTGKALNTVADKSSEVAKNVADGTKNVASTVYDGTKNTASNVYDGTKNLAATGVEKTGHAWEGSSSIFNGFFV